MKEQNQTSKKIRYIIVAWIGIVAGTLFVTILWNEITYNTNIKPKINLMEYQYERELEHSPCVSPDGTSVLKIVAVYKEQRGRTGYILGFVHSKETNKKEWIYAQKCMVSFIPGTDYFRVNGGYSFDFPDDNIFYWEDNDTVVIDTHEIDIQNEKTYYFNRTLSSI